MKNKRIFIIEDNALKYVYVERVIKEMGITDIDWAKDSVSAINMIKKAKEADCLYDLVISDMFFDWMGRINPNAGQYVFNEFHKMGINIPTIFCSSDRVNVTGSVGSVHYVPSKDWESDLRALVRKVFASDIISQ